MQNVSYSSKPVLLHRRLLHRGGRRGSPLRDSGSTARELLFLRHQPTLASFTQALPPPLPFSRLTTEPPQIEGASYYVGAAVALLAWMTARRTFSVYGALDRFPPSARAKR